MKQNPQTIKEIKAMLRRATPQVFPVLERSLAADMRKGVQEELALARRRFAALEMERQRIQALYDFDASYSCGIVIGLDEVGRGPVAGPLAVGAVVLAHDVRIEGLNDSKQIPEHKRETIANAIKKYARAWTVQYIEAEEIDQEGMSKCLRKAFSSAICAIEHTGIQADCVLIDGNSLHIDEREQNVIKGDTKSASIAAASLIAKVARDRRMCDYAVTYPGYNFERNKGYASEEHIEAIRRLGLCPIHRKSFCSGFLQDSLF